MRTPLSSDFQLLQVARVLNVADGSGTFPFGVHITDGLTKLGDPASQAVNSLADKTETTQSAARSAGNLLEHREDANASKVASAPSNSGSGSPGTDFGGMMSGGDGGSKPSLTGRDLGALLGPNRPAPKAYVPSPADIAATLVSSKPKSRAVSAKHTQVQRWARSGAPTS